jgi:hypothetical protein
MPPDTADRLRALLVSETRNLPPAIVASGEPAEILAYAAGISQGAAAQVDAKLTSIELAAVDTATPGGYINEALAACRDSGRTTAIVSRHSADGRVRVGPRGPHRCPARGGRRPMTFILSGFADEISPELSEQLATLAAESISHLELRSVWSTNVADLDATQLALARSGCFL